MAITLNGTTGITTPDVNTDDLSVDTDTLFVDAANNRVGIGTAAPAAPLHVFTTSSEQARFVRDLTTDAGLSIQSDNSGPILDTVGVHNLRFFTSASERARIDSSGNLLVGTTSTISGPGRVQIAYTAGSQVGAVIKPSADSLATAIQFLNAAGTQVGYIATTASATSYVTSSDYRLKEDIQPVADASSRLATLKPVNFAWKIDGSRVDGFLAHELQAVVPEAVVGAKDAVDADGNPVYQGIDQSKLVPLLTAALQEALTKISQLETRIAALEGGA